MKPQQNQYRGALSASEIAEGMNVAHQNAVRLVRDARLLFDNKSYASAVALSILAIEEAGKGPVLRGLALAHDEAELREAWRNYRSHTKKNVLWPLIDLYTKGARRANDFLPLFQSDAEHPFILDQLKQLSFYTDCLRKGHWSVPEEVATKEIAEDLLKIAEGLSHGRKVTTEEIDLWIQYIRPVWRTKDASQALFEWDKEVRRRGLARKDSSVTMEQFFVDGFHAAKKA
jgi:AbiV family abortive infection protein